MSQGNNKYHITQREQAEETLREREERFRSFIENANDLIITFTNEGIITYISPNCKTLSGFEQEEYIGNNFGSFIHPSDVSQIWQTINKLLKEFKETGDTTSQISVEYKGAYKFGLWSYFEAKPSIITGKDGMFEFVCIARDITKRKHMENALRESKNLLDGVFESIQQGISVLSSDLIIRHTNNTMKKWHYQKLPLEGKPCFQTFQNREEPCDPCPTLRCLESGEMEKEEVYAKTSLGEKWLEIFSYPLKEGTKTTGAVEFVQDITERKQVEESLKYQFKSEKIVSDISSYFVSLHSHQLDSGINYALKLSGEFFQVDRSYVFQFSADQKTMSNTHEWCTEGIEPQMDFLQDNLTDHTPWWMKKLRNFENIIIPCVDELPEQADEEKRILKSQSIQSALVVPIESAGNLIGFLGFDTVKGKKVWTENQVTLLKVVAELISHALTKYYADKKIRHLSFHDQLTDLYNRTYLEEEMHRLDTKRQLPISIIMADVNGLKLVNDTYGHSIGDEMLKNAAENLKASCREEDIIARWGGDEFIILLPRTTKKEALAICKRISNNCCKSYVEDVPISMATGVASKDNKEKNLAKLLKEAEDHMYRHKLIESRSVRNAVLNSLLKTLEEKSYETQTHTRRMQKVALKIGKKRDLPDSELSRLSLLITLHDIGKINIPEELLTKKNALTQEEWKIMKKHPETGYRIARATDEFAHVAEDILAHHENWDGTGYPQGLKGKEIPILARITAIADAYEVMTNGRPYKKAMSQEEVVAEIKRCAGTQFDPELVDIFLLGCPY